MHLHENRQTGERDGLEMVELVVVVIRDPERDEAGF